MEVFARPSIRHVRHLKTGVINKQIQIAFVSTSRSKHSAQSSSLDSSATSIQPSPQPPANHRIGEDAGLSALPLSSVLRTYAILSMSSSPLVMRVSTSFLESSLKSNWLLNVDKNPLLRWLLKKTFYTQFCLGETGREVEHGLRSLKRDVGYNGIMLEYAAEVLDEGGPEVHDPSVVAKAVQSWRDDLLETIRLVDDGDYVALKWSGMGPAALRLLTRRQLPSAEMEDAMDSICEAALAKHVALLPASEPQGAQAGVDDWTLHMARKYNKKYPIVHNTYQCYLKSTPQTLAEHLDIAARENFVLGVKLVRGAYLHSEPRHFIWDTIEETHRCYDGMAAQILKQAYGGMLKPVESATSSFPRCGLVLATHNLDSLKSAHSLWQQTDVNAPPLPVAYAQLYGMAVDTSLLLLAASKNARSNQPARSAPKIFVYATWGKLGDCLGYLLRRAKENREAMSRTNDTRIAMGRELKRRAWSMYGRTSRN